MALHGRAPALWESPPLCDHCGEHGLRSADSRTELCYLTGGFRNGDIERPGLWDTCLPPCHPHRPCGPCQGPFAAPEAHLSRPTTAFLQTLNNSAASSRASERHLLGVAHCREWDQETDQAGGSRPSAWQCQGCTGPESLSFIGRCLSGLRVLAIFMFMKLPHTGRGRAIHGQSNFKRQHCKIQSNRNRAK